MQYRVFRTYKDAHGQLEQLTEAQTPEKASANVREVLDKLETEQDLADDFLQEEAEVLEIEPGMSPDDLTDSINARGLIVDGREYREMLYYLGYSSEYDVDDENLAAAIRRFDEVVVPLIYRKKPHLPTAYKAEMANQIVVTLQEQDHPSAALCAIIDAAIENIKDDRGYPEEDRFPADQFVK